jgi:hypothetical protein
MTLQQGLGNRAVQSRLGGCPALAACPTGGACHSCPFRGPPAVSPAPAGLQPKLVVGPPGDRYEQQADRVADQVVGRAEPEAAAGPGTVPPPSGATLQRACDSCGPDDERPIQRAPADGAAADTPAHAAEAGRAASILPSSDAGRPLPATARQYFEPRFGQAFGDVRVHTDAAADASARAVRARAYTVGRDIAFAAGQYAPETGEGRRLLAHELTHVVQQAGGIGGTARLQRQPDEPPELAPNPYEGNAPAQAQTPVTNPPPLAPNPYVGTPPPTTAPTSAPAPAGWSGCASTQLGALNAELQEAAEWVTAALADLNRKDGRPLRTSGALRRYLTPDDAAVTGTIIPKLKLILDELAAGPTNFRCQTEAECKAVHPTGANAYAGNPITLCPGYFAKERLDRITTLIHEAGHNAGLEGNVVQWEWPFAGLSDEKRLGNTESYAAFVRSKRYPLLPPVQQAMGVNVGVGFSPGIGGPRWVVSAEYDPVIARRVFRAFDLHLAERLDFDSEGRFIGSLSVGPRIFSPLAPGRTRMFLDLRAGVAGVLDPSGAGTLTAGPSTGARLGLGGNISGSIDWQRVWGVMKDDPNIDTVTIRGEIRW